MNWAVTLEPDLIRWGTVESNQASHSKVGLHNIDNRMPPSVSYVAQVMLTQFTQQVRNDNYNAIVNDVNQNLKKRKCFKKIDN